MVGGLNAVALSHGEVKAAKSLSPKPLTASEYREPARISVFTDISQGIKSRLETRPGSSSSLGTSFETSEEKSE